MLLAVVVTLQFYAELIFGRIHWKLPAWPGILWRRFFVPIGRGFWHLWRKLRDSSPATKRRLAMSMAAVAVVVFAGYRGWQWWKNRPKPPEPITVSASVHVPDATPLTDSGISDFKPLVLEFTGSTARLEDVGKILTAGVTLTPDHPGTWRWDTDRTLRFTPKADWPVGQRFKVTFNRTLFPNHIIVNPLLYEFQSPAFEADLASYEFYQDPQDPKIKKAVATVRFTHPVDPATFEPLVHFTLVGHRDDMPADGRTDYGFKVEYDKYKGEAYLHSDLIPIPKDNVQMKLVIDAGIRSSKGGGAYQTRMDRSVTVPGMYALFHVNSSELNVVRNEQFEPERVLIVEFNLGVLESEASKNLEAWILPKDRPAMGRQPAIPNYYWGSTEEIGLEILKLSKKLELKAIPTEKEYSTVHPFKYNASPGQFVYLRIKEGVKGYGGYILAKSFTALHPVEKFPEELKIMHNGSILSLSGGKAISILARDIRGIRYTLGRVLPEDLNHLISQTSGTFANPSFQYGNFGEENLSEQIVETQKLPRTREGQTQYTSFDFTKYLNAPGGGVVRGLYFFRLESWDPDTDKGTVQGRSPYQNQFESEEGSYSEEGDSQEEGEEYDYQYRRSYRSRRDASDSRFVLITDLGILIKDWDDGSHDLFVQSISAGGPVEGAKVSVLGKNGVPVAEMITGADGKVHIPNLSDFHREKEPVVFLVRKDSDLSFMPYARRDRDLSFTRFDIGGVRTRAAGNSLTAFLFSDRGIYRPGDEAHIGVIVREPTWSKGLAGIPLEYSVTDPRGIEIIKEKIRLAAAGFEDIRVPTRETSPTGMYTVSLYLIENGYRSGLLGSTSIRVEEFLPDRLRINVRLSADRDDGWVAPESIQGLVTLNNLFGTPAEKRRVAGQISFNPSFPQLKSWPGYQFYDPLRAKSAYEESLPDTQTDEKGEASFDLDLSRFSDATYRLTFRAEGYEADSGRGVSGAESVLVSPLKYLVGYKADGDLQFINRGSERNVSVAAVGPDGKAIPVNDLTAHLLEIRYVSVLTRQPNGTYKYESVLKEVTVSKNALGLPAKGVTWKVPSEKPGEYALVIRDKDDTELNRVPFVIAGDANLTRTLDRNAELQVRLNRPDFNPGDEIEIQIKAPYTGAGLITVERDRVFTHKWFKTDSTASVQTIRVPEDLEGNGYVVVSFVRSLDSPEIYMSPLSYGVVPFSVSRARRTVEIGLTAPELARPGQKFPIRYKTDRPGKIVIYAVDEGILQVAHYSTPDPLSYFFQKRALEVSTRQILDLILPEFSVVKALSATGGDEGYQLLGQNLNPFKRKRDKPVAYWSGIVDAGLDEKTVTYDVPDYFSGSLRVMAVAVATDAIGVAQKSSVVRGHFVLSPNAPTFVAPGDEFEVSTGVSNLVEGSGSNAQVVLEIEPSENLVVVGETRKTLAIPEKRESSEKFLLKSVDAPGNATITFKASAGGKTGKISTTLSIRPAEPHFTRLTSGDTRDPAIELPVTRKMYSHYRKLEIGASVLPLALSGGLARYLEEYPYGCSEQIVSKGIPALALLQYPEFGFDPAKAEANFRNTTSILKSRQDSSGGIGIWTANEQISDFHTAYAAHYLTEAKERGMPVPDDLLQGTLNYLDEVAQKSARNPWELRIQSYSIYLLVRNGRVESRNLSAMRQRLDDAAKAGGWNAYQDITSLYMAASYKLMKQEDEARDLIKEFKISLPVENEYTNYYFYDQLIRDSIYLDIVSRHFPKKAEELTGEQIRLFLKPLTKGYYNSVSSAYAILALTSYAKIATMDKAMKISLAEIGAKGEEKAIPASKGLFVKGPFSPEATKLKVHNESGHTAFYQVVEAGFDSGPATTVVRDGIEIQREYHKAGNVSLSGTAGENLEVHLKVRSTDKRSYWNVAIVDLLPGGFEVPSGAVPGGDFRATYTDVREDRVLTFGDVGPDVTTFIYTIRATNPGNYQTPPPFAESMYDRTVQARGLSARMTVVAP